MEQAVAGYYESLGSRTEYQAGYRAAFRIGYGEGFESSGAALAVGLPWYP